MSTLLAALSRWDVLAALCGLAVTSVLYIRRRWIAVPYPPGPRGLPVIGNLLDVPPQWQWIEYAKWSKEFDSPIIHLDILGSHVFIINDAEVAHEILEKRATLYSDRPRLVMLNEVCGFDWNWGFMRYGEFWRTCRRHFDTFFRETEAKKFREQQTEETHRFLRRVLDKPESVSDHLKLFSGSLILNIGYGIKVDSHHNEFIDIMENGNHGLNATMDHPLVDILPWTQHLPGWGWKAKRDIWRKNSRAMVDVPYNYAKDSVVNGTANPSVAVSLLERRETDEQESTDADITESIIKSTCATLYTAGTDTTGSILTSLLVVLVAFPEVQRKAQEELDRVIGSERLPTFSDKADLPYINALVLELIRWTCIVPLGLPHSNTVDDIYQHNGKSYFIPKGSSIIYNSWQMCYNESDYPMPETFQPERFLTADGTKLNPIVKSPDPAFGFRSRVCPGRWAAQDSQFIMAASILTCFNVHSVDKQAMGTNVQDLFLPGLVMCPKPLKYSIVPRSKDVVELIKHTT